MLREHIDSGYGDHEMVSIIVVLLMRLCLFEIYFSNL